MARAKRTDRAEARRRYRAQLAEHEALAGEEGTAPATTPTRATQPAREQPPARPSITYAFRNSFRQANVREDLAYLPTLVLRSKAVWLPCLLAAASGVALIAFGVNTVTVLFFQYFAYVLPVGALFLAGFLAPRASYLAGILVGAFATLVLAAVMATGALGTELGPELGPGILANGFVTSTIGGALVASAAAWYKRFLSLANPNRGRRPPPRGRQQPRRR